jgi:hypothetical protein
VTAGAEAAAFSVVAAGGVAVVLELGLEVPDDIVAIHQMSHMTKITMIIATIVFPVFDIYFSYYFNKFMLTE